MMVAGLNVAFFYARVFARLQRTGAGRRRRSAPDWPAGCR